MDLLSKVMVLCPLEATAGEDISKVLSVNYTMPFCLEGNRLALGYTDKKFRGLRKEKAQPCG
jgi:hypothetical protein